MLMTGLRGVVFYRRVGLEHEMMTHADQVMAAMPPGCAVRTPAGCMSAFISLTQAGFGGKTSSRKHCAPSRAQCCATTDRNPSTKAGGRKSRRSRRRLRDERRQVVSQERRWQRAAPTAWHACRLQSSGRRAAVGSRFRSRRLFGSRNGPVEDEMHRTPPPCGFAVRHPTA